MRSICHVTLTTGHIRPSLEGEVSDELVVAMKHLIGRICQGEVSEPVSLKDYADVGDYSVTGRQSGGCLVVLVYADGPPSQLICTIGVASDPQSSESLWRNLHKWGNVPVVTDPGSCPNTPWVASALDEGIVWSPEAAHWLGDFERCLAWAWLDRK